LGNLIEFPTANITQISPLGQKKISKSPSLNPTHLVFPTIPRARPIFSYYFYILLNEYLMEKNLFNIQMSKHYETNLMYPLLIKTFPTIPRAWRKALWFERSQSGKQNKQTTFLNRYHTYLG